MYNECCEPYNVFKITYFMENDSIIDDVNYKLSVCYKKLIISDTEELF